MKKIQSFDNSRLRTEEDFGFQLAVKAEISTLPTNIPPEPEEDEPVVQSTGSDSSEGWTTALGAAIDGFVAQLEAFDVALKESTKLASVADATLADEERDTAWSAANLYIRAMLGHPDASAVAAAEVLRALFLKYGNPVSLPRAEETGVLHNLIIDLEALDSATIEAAAFTSWLERLKVKATAYEEAARVQNAEEANRLVGVVKEARKASGEGYAKLVETVNAHVILFGDAPYATFIDRVNALIDKQKTNLKSRKTKAAKKKEEEEDAPVVEE